MCMQNYSLYGEEALSFQLLIILLKTQTCVIPHRYDESDRCWTGILREITYAEGATVLPASLNILRLNKL